MRDLLARQRRRSEGRVASEFLCRMLFWRGPDWNGSPKGRVGLKGSPVQRIFRVQGMNPLPGVSGAGAPELPRRAVGTKCAGNIALRGVVTPRKPLFLPVGVY